MKISKQFLKKALNRMEGFQTMLVINYLFSEKSCYLRNLKEKY